MHSTRQRVIAGSNEAWRGADHAMGRAPLDAFNSGTRLPERRKATPATATIRRRRALILLLNLAAGTHSR